MWKDDVIELLRYLPEARWGGGENSRGEAKRLGAVDNFMAQNYSLHIKLSMFE